ncbi:type I secretion system permease/ATPase [Limnohabitans sp. G3-2]|uniref:type I secretion system permease/ATPase n=1 Tax=Limnohabitans sp. G3-2 TaxID=1100711 RepID=UPI0013046EEE|nr:type I secretion system permease/ATPase [Limnohabitans sp. G3-2]
MSATPQQTLAASAALGADPLLHCLALASHLLGLPVHVSALRVGFAVDDNGHVPAAALPDLARVHGLMAAWSRVKPSAVPGYVLPVIVPLQDGRACVLRTIEQGQAQILSPETGQQELVMPVSELDALASGEVLVVKLPPQRADQTLTPMQGAAFDWFWGTLWRFRHFYVESMLATVVANILALASVFFTMNVYDRVVPTQAYASLWTLAIGTLVAAVLEYVMRWLKARLVDLGGKRADLAINATLLREIMSIRLEHRPQSIGIFSSSMKDFEALRDFFSSASLVVLADLPFVVVFILLIAIVGGPLAWIPALAVPVVLLLAWWVQKPLMVAMRENMKESGDKQSVLVEAVLNLELLKAHNAEGYLQRRWEQSNLAGADSYRKIRSLSNAVTGFISTLSQVATVAMVVWGVYLIHANQLTLGGLIACVILLGRAISPLGSVMGLASRFQQARTALETLDGLIQRPRDREVGKRYVVPEQVQGRIEALDLEFAYPGESRLPVIRRLNLGLEAGSHLALLGRVGSGKSTLIRLMAGLYDPLGGSVRVDGIDMRQLDPAELRARIGYVSQDPQLFMGTLRENLILSDSWISDAKIVQVLQTLDLYNMVAAHPKGLDMPLTEAGGGLSGGQRQLVTLARLMLRDPALVFMDEPTANMDQNTEARVIAVLGQWLQGRTLVLSTHRTQLLEWVDRIAVIDAGQCVLEGPKAEMIEKLSKGISVGAKAPATPGGAA